MPQLRAHKLGADIVSATLTHLIACNDKMEGGKRNVMLGVHTQLVSVNEEDYAYLLDAIIQIKGATSALHNTYMELGIVNQLKG